MYLGRYILPNTSPQKLSLQLTGLLTNPISSYNGHIMHYMQYIFRLELGGLLAN